jgi:hypothetical protein
MKYKFLIIDRETMYFMPKHIFPSNIIRTGQKPSEANILFVRSSYLKYQINDGFEFWDSEIGNIRKLAIISSDDGHTDYYFLPLPHYGDIFKMLEHSTPQQLRHTQYDYWRIEKYDEILSYDHSPIPEGKLYFHPLHGIIKRHNGTDHVLYVTKNGDTIEIDPSDNYLEAYEKYQHRVWFEDVVAKNFKHFQSDNHKWVDSELKKVWYLYKTAKDIIDELK